MLISVESSKCFIRGNVWPIHLLFPNSLHKGIFLHTHHVSLYTFLTTVFPDFSNLLFTKNNVQHAYTCFRISVGPFIFSFKVYPLSIPSHPSRLGTLGTCPGHSCVLTEQGHQDGLCIYRQQESLNIQSWCHSHRTMGRALSLHAADPDPIPSTPQK